MLRIAGNYTFEATREEVWSAINDPEVLARTIPGCQKLEQVGDNEYDSTLKIGLQAVKGVYSGRVCILDQEPPLHYRITVDGKGSNGFLKGEGSINLREDGPTTTILDYGGEAQVGGTIASVGQRLLDGAAKTLINQSLKALAAQIEARRAEPTVIEAAPLAAEPAIPVNGARAAVEPTAAAAAPIAVTTAVGTVSEAAALAGAPAMPAPPEPAPTVAPAVAPAVGFERRSIVVPAHEQLTEQDVAWGVVEDFFKERPWLPWALVAFLIGYILGRRK